MHRTISKREIEVDRFSVEHRDIVEAKLALRNAGISFEQVSAYQLKVGKFNFYPTTGKITMDGGPKIAERGLTSFIKLVRLLKAPAISGMPANKSQRASRQVHGLMNRDPEALRRSKELCKTILALAAPQKQDAHSSVDTARSTPDFVIEKGPPWDS